MPASFRSQAVKGGIWSGVQSLGTTLMLFICNIILARLLTPNDFGAVALLLVFVTICDAVVDGGFTAALVQRKEVDDVDYSTIFIWNLFVSLLLYALLFVSSPAIGHFYHQPRLAIVLQVFGSYLVIRAFGFAQRAKLTRELAFKTLALVTLVANLIGSFVAIGCAWTGWGIWSLVVKMLVTAAVETLILWLISSWHPSSKFSFEAFKSMFRFGNFVFLTYLLNTIYDNIVSLIIGRNFSPAALGYYTQGRKLQEVPRLTLCSVVNKVAFPVMSTLHGDVNRLNAVMRQSLSVLCFITFPLAVLLMVIAKPLVLLLFTAKWLTAASYLQVLCLHGLIMSAVDLEQEALKALGKSDWLFTACVVRRLIGIALVVGGMHWGVKGVLVGFVLSKYVSFAIVTWPLERFIGFGLLKQVKSMLPNLLIAVVAGGVTYLLAYYLSGSILLWQVIWQSVLFVVCYLGVSYVCHLKALKTVTSLVG